MAEEDDMGEIIKTKEGVDLHRGGPHDQIIHAVIESNTIQW